MVPEGGSLRLVQNPPPQLSQVPPGRRAANWAHRTSWALQYVSEQVRALGALPTTELLAVLEEHEHDYEDGAQP